MKKLFLSATAIATVMSASAFAADLPLIKSAPVAVPAPLWTGFYAGLNSGYGIGTSNNAANNGWANSNYFSSFSSLRFFPPAITGASSYMGRGIYQGGFVGGGQVGYNYQYGQGVLGLEVDMQGAGIRGTGNADGWAPRSNTTSYINNKTVQAGIDWLGTARVRVGYLIAPTVQLYATGGLAYGGAYQNNFLTYALQEGANINGTAYIPTQNSTQKLLVGWTAGGGAEWKFMQNWSIKGEAVYYDLGSLSVSNLTYYPDNGFAGRNPLGGSTSLAYYSGILSRLGVNYHFNFASAPVVAKF